MRRPHSITGEMIGGLIKLVLDSEGNLRKFGLHDEKVDAVPIGKPEVLRFNRKDYVDLFRMGAMGLNGPNPKADSYMEGEVEVLKDTPTEYLAVLPFQYFQIKK